MQAAGGVDDDDVGAVPLRLLDRVEGDGRRVAAALAAHEARLSPPSPDLELLLRGCAVRVRGAQDDLVPVLAQA